ncbi:L-lactate dehydrogenase A-like [Panicum miliaceum]|uniref:L-lactate dehydrogenase n=1 Tax=Panicum miliaceum TaxID=4540 RepID=A0A3L6RKP6_PANMI|nr:L-lactate dehydrogenase A-like [Panicum miliaceum]
MKKASSLSELGFDVASGFFRPVAVDAGLCTHHRRLTKVSVIGAGNVDMTIAQTILTRGLADEIALVSGETRLDLLQRNVALFRKIVPPLAEHSPDAVLLVVSNPVDVLTYVAWKLSGFPVSRVIGSGTNLDSSRFRFLLADHLDVNAQDVQAYMVGEHGDSSVAVWSTVSVAGMPVLKSLQESHGSFDEEALEGIRRAVVNTPTRLGRGGVLGVADMELTEEEATRLRHSAKTLWENSQLLGL